ncbi:hypothetical protein MMC25_005218 [Agyrium rufum]|nr:hypothetical protein [Agyrium rufum]
MPVHDSIAQQRHDKFTERMSNTSVARNPHFSLDELEMGFKYLKWRVPNLQVTPAADLSEELRTAIVNRVMATPRRPLSSLSQSICRYYSIEHGQFNGNADVDRHSIEETLDGILLGLWLPDSTHHVCLQSSFGITDTQLVQDFGISPGGMDWLLHWYKLYKRNEK